MSEVDQEVEDTMQAMIDKILEEKVVTMLNAATFYTYEVKLNKPTYITLVEEKPLGEDQTPTPVLQTKIADEGAYVTTLAVARHPYTKKIVQTSNYDLLAYYNEEYYRETFGDRYKKIGFEEEPHV